MKRRGEMLARVMRRRCRREIAKRRMRPARMLCSRFYGRDRVADFAPSTVESTLQDWLRGTR